MSKISEVREWVRIKGTVTAKITELGKTETLVEVPVYVDQLVPVFEDGTIGDPLLPIERIQAEVWSKFLKTIEKKNAKG